MLLELTKFFYAHWILTLSFTVVNWVGLFAVTEVIVQAFRKS